MSDKLTASDLVARIRAKYSGNAYAVLHEVAAGTGAGANSWVDAAVFSLWPTNGIWRAAFEVKVSRQDFLCELAKPTKNEWARECFDFFWYVVGSGVAKDDEIPTGCGLMAIHGAGLKIVKQAPRRENVRTDDTIIASFARSLTKELENMRHAVYREALENSYEHKRAKACQDACERFLRKRGVDYWGTENAGEVFEALTKASNGPSPELHEIQHAHEVLGKFQSTVLGFMLELAPMAAHLLTARDDADEFICERFGHRDEVTVDALKRVLKGRLKKRERTRIKKTVEVRQIIADQVEAAESP